MCKFGNNVKTYQHMRLTYQNMRLTCVSVHRIIEISAVSWDLSPGDVATDLAEIGVDVTKVCLPVLSVALQFVRQWADD